MINKILKKLDEMIDSQTRIVENALGIAQEKEVWLETEKLISYLEVKDMIKKCEVMEENYETNNKKP